jgi:hypothetical protein
MTRKIIKEGCAIFYYGNGPIHDAGRPHKYIIVGFDKVNEKLFMIPICTASPGFENICLLDQNTAGLKLRHKSYVDYNNSAIVSLDDILKKIKAGKAEYVGVIDDTTLARVKKGLELSKLNESIFKKKLAAIHAVSPSRIPRIFT